MTVIVDTNIYFSAFYNLQGNEAEIIRRANADEVVLLSPDIVKEELKRVLGLKLGSNEEEAASLIASLPVIWVPKAEYSGKLKRARSMLTHEEDSPILACALKFKTGVLTGNTKHFDVPQVRRDVLIWSSKKLLQYLESRKS